MQIKKVLTAAGLTIAMGAFAPSVFAQAGAGGAAAGGAPVTSGTGQGVTGQAPSTGAPGTQAPASAAPVGSASSDYMAHEGANGPENSSISGPAATNAETHARWLETKTERDIVAARAKGMNVAKAQHQKWLGSTALSKGDRPGAIRHFERAENDLRAEGYRVSRNGVQYNDTRTNLNANETSQNPNAANMHSNNGTNSAY
ncbi:MAG: hypothetical protein JO166_03960 [Deltaproteobacteria bacterium]|nr:hypothetical protein [Deltaproteobacteria bacterium]